MNIFKRILNWKYRYLVGKHQAVEKMILDLQFKRYKTREVREEIRAQYDSHQARLASVLDRLKLELSKEDKAALEDQKVLLERDSERYKKQIDALDIEVNGAAPSNDFPEGVQGINSQIESLEELKLMLRDYYTQV
jgi:hypothetical protein